MEKWRQQRSTPPPFVQTQCQYSIYIIFIGQGEGTLYSALLTRPAETALRKSDIIVVVLQIPISKNIIMYLIYYFVHYK